jgi:hypothetical protein
MSFLAASALSLLPSIALACPSCGLRDNEPGRWLLVAGMVTLPFAVAGTSILLIKKMMRHTEE